MQLEDADLIETKKKAKKDEDINLTDDEIIKAKILNES
jgi:hypothetical protein